MEQSKIDRINELARKKKAGEVLTEEELAEQAALRREYVEWYMRGLRGTLDNTVIVRPDGTREKIEKKK